MVELEAVAVHPHAAPLRARTRPRPPAPRSATSFGLTCGPGTIPAGGSLAGKDSVDLLVAAGVVDTEAAERLEERVLRGGERHAVLRPARPGEARLDGREVELDRLRVLRLHRGLVPELLLLAVRLDELDLLGASAGELEVAERLVVDREEPAGRAVLGRHVPDRRAVGEREPVQALAVVLDELPDDPELAQDLRDRQDEVGRRRALAELAGQLEADHLRDEHRDRLAEHRRLGLDPADAPAEDAEPVHHRRVGVGADERVREGPERRPSSSRASTTRARYSRLTWWTMPVFGGTTLKFLNAC